MTIVSRMPWPEGNPPSSWADVEWPEWVPAEVRKQIERFWGTKAARGPVDYERSATSDYSNTPAFGERVRLVESGTSIVEGRYVHAWNNMGRVIGDDGSVSYPSTNSYGPQGAKWLAEVEAKVAAQEAKKEDADLLNRDYDFRLNGAPYPVTGREMLRVLRNAETVRTITLRADGPNG